MMPPPWALTRLPAVSMKAMPVARAPVIVPIGPEEQAPDPPVLAAPPVLVVPPVALVPPVLPAPPVALVPPVMAAPPLAMVPPTLLIPPVALVPPVLGTVVVPPALGDPPVALVPPVLGAPPVALAPPMLTEPPVAVVPPALLVPPIVGVPPVAVVPPVPKAPPNVPTVPPVGAAVPPAASAPPDPPGPLLSLEPEQPPVPRTATNTAVTIPEIGRYAWVDVNLTIHTPSAGSPAADPQGFDGDRSRENTGCKCAKKSASAEYNVMQRARTAITGKRTYPSFGGLRHRGQHPNSNCRSIRL